MLNFVVSTKLIRNYLANMLTTRMYKQWEIKNTITMIFRLIKYDNYKVLKNLIININIKKIFGTYIF